MTGTTSQSGREFALIIARITLTFRFTQRRQHGVVVAILCSLIQKRHTDRGISVLILASYAGQVCDG